MFIPHTKKIEEILFQPRAFDKSPLENDVKPVWKKPASTHSALKNEVHFSKTTFNPLKLPNIWCLSPLKTRNAFFSAQNEYSSVQLFGASFRLHKTLLPQLRQWNSTEMETHAFQSSKWAPSDGNGTPGQAATTGTLLPLKDTEKDNQQERNSSHRKDFATFGLVRRG